MITLEYVYWLMGALAGGVAYVNARDPSNPRRWNNTAFWGLYAITFLVGSRLPHVASGGVVIAMVLVASVGKLGQTTRESQTAAQRDASAVRWGNRLFIPALTIPAVTLLGNLVLKSMQVGGAPLVDPKQVTQVSLALGALAGLAVGMLMLRPPAAAPLHEARRLWDSVGWAAVLPQMLAALGALFATAGVGKVVAGLAERWLPLGTPLAAVVTYTVGMALFTMIMGNAFAAFPVMTAGIGLPLIMSRFGGDVTIMAAVGMLSGFCGTLMTPMAANYNIVPAALLELPDEYAVIKAQIPTALLLLAVNTAVMYAFVYRR
ncbi:MAG TPA: DUF979 domain-containing protein [Gemmatimonadaceae bacterium]|nr:DUF979 domain-containing protein [Gemmatimonadaceae bacterium]